MLQCGPPTTEAKAYPLVILHPVNVHMAPEWRQIILEDDSSMPRHVSKAPPPPCRWKLIP